MDKCINRKLEIELLNLNSNGTYEIKSILYLNYESDTKVISCKLSIMSVETEIIELDDVIVNFFCVKIRG